VFSELDSFFIPTEKIVDEALERHADMQTTKKGEQLLENVEDFTTLQ
jgi:hypothetical protein